MTMIERFVKERNEALFSLDRKKIEAYLIKYGETEFADTRICSSGQASTRRSAVSSVRRRSWSIKLTAGLLKTGLLFPHK